MIAPSTNIAAVKEPESEGAMSQVVTMKRGRKPKQSILNDYFAVQNSILNETKESLHKVISDVNSSSTKSSRYGRVIKPKLFDIESMTKPKKDRKSCKELTNEQESIQKPSGIAIEIKTESEATKPLKKRKEKQSDYLNSPDNIVNDSTIELNFEMQMEESLITSTPTVEQRRRGRKSTKRTSIPIIEMMQESLSDKRSPMDSMEEVKIEHTDTPKVMPKRLGRPPKMSKLNDSANQISTIESNISSEPTPIAIKLEIQETLTNQVKKRGRKPKNRVTEIPIAEIYDSSVNDNVPVEGNQLSTQQIENSQIPQENASILDASLPSTSQCTEVPVNVGNNSNVSIIKPRGRGRPKIIKPQDDEVDNNSPKFICGNCQSAIPERKWKAHVATHLGVSFRVGIDDPIDVEDSATMGRLMIRFMKVNKIQYLRCPKCDAKKKSALGYISHVELCGLTPEEVDSLKAECEFCKKLYRKVSLPSHQQTFCPVRRLEMAQQQADQEVETATKDDQNVEVIYSESGRPKRMIKKIKPISKPTDDFIKVGLKITGGTVKGWLNHLRDHNQIRCTNDMCEYIAKDLAEMRKHFKQCRDSILQCKICHKIERSRDIIEQHIETEHPDELKAHEPEVESDNSNDDDFKTGFESSSSSDGEYCDNEDNEQQIDPTWKKKGKVRRRHVVPLKRIMEDEAPAYWEMISAFYTRILNPRPGFHKESYEWTEEFIEENYDVNALALKKHLRNTFEIVRLPQREVNKFLGLLHTKSPKYSCQKEIEYKLERSEDTGENWNSLNLFESVKSTHIDTESSNFYCGGRIITAEWIPFPKGYTGNQMLAICAQGKNIRPINLTNCVPTEKCKSLIQLWSISTNSGMKIDKTEFMYGIAYENGPICTMSFCPSDVYVASKRLAILALPDIVGSINIISIPDNVSKAKTNTSTVIKLKADIRLQLGVQNEENSPQTITQMIWSRTKGHKILCAGYNTGLVAIWNFDHMNSTYMLQKGASDGIPILLPQKTFMGTLSYITQLDMHPDNDGNIRWILVGSLDRRVRLYDLEDPQLLPFTSPIFKSRIISGKWPLNWPLYLTNIDAVYTQQSGGLHIKPILYTNNQPPGSNLFNECEPSNLSFSDWFNSAIYGNEVGDLFMVNFQQLLLHDRYDDSTKQYVLSSTDVFIDDQLTNDVDNDNNIDNDDDGDDSTGLNDRIRILFKDFNKHVIASKLNTRRPIIPQKPYARITHVAINPNESHQHLYAIGYELGFCRIHFIPG